MSLFGGLNYNDLGGTLDSEQGDRSAKGYSWHMIVDNFTRLFLTNLICVAFLIPALVGFTFGSIWDRPQILLLSGVLGGALAAPSYIAMYDAALMSYRGYPGRWWERYKLVLKREWKGSLVPGMVVGLLAAMVINIVTNLYDGNRLPDMMLVSIVIAVLVALAVFSYLWIQRLMLDLPLTQILHNSWLLAMMHPAVTLGAIAFRVVYWGLLLILYPYSFVFLFFLGVWFPAFINVRIVYNTMDRDMKLDERYEAAQEDDAEE